LNSGFSLDVNGVSTVHVVSNAQGSVLSNGSSIVKVQAPLLTSIQSDGVSTVEINGNVDGGSIDGASTVFVTGDISGSLSITGVSTLNANTISGSINSDGASKVNAASCDNVKSGTGTMSSCKVRRPPVLMWMFHPLVLFQVTLVSAASFYLVAPAMDLLLDPPSRSQSPSSLVLQH
jgi:hypothetical protein